MIVSRRSALAASLVAFGACSARANEDEGALALARRLEATDTPGMAALLIRDFRVETEIVAGRRRLGDSSPIQPGDRWHLGSDGKAMTATMIARLVERGVLSWDEPLSQMLPQLAATMNPAFADVTLPDMLSHRSGIPNDGADALFDTFYVDASPPEVQRARYADAILRLEPAAPKRGDPSYSNNGYVVAAVCAEHASGRDFERLMLEEVFEPLCMRSVDFDPLAGPEGPSGHVDGRVANRARDTNPRMFAPAGGITMSMPDWARFCIEHMGGRRGESALLSSETFRFLQAPRGQTYAALGWGHLETMMDRRGPVLFHSGSDGNWTALVSLFYETGNGVLVAANAYQSMGGDRAANEVMGDLIASVVPPT